MNKIEQVARAIDPMAAKVADMLLNKGVKHKDVLTILPMDKARAAIEAMREPTDAMMEGENDLSLAIWESMIDAALKDE